MHYQSARVVILAALVALAPLAEAFAQNSLRRSQTPAATQDTAPVPFRQEQTTIRLTYTDPNPREVTGEGSRDPGFEPIIPRRQFGGMAGAMEDVVIEIIKSGQRDASETEGTPSVETDAATARVTITLTPDYEQPYRELDIYNLRLTTTSVEASFGETMRPSVMSDLRQELAQTLAQIGLMNGLVLTSAERTELIGGGQLRLKLEQPRGLSVFEHHALFNRPAASLLLKRRPINNEPSLRFVTLEADGRAQSMSAIRIDQPFYVEAFYPIEVDQPQGPLTITVAGEEQTLTLARTEDPKIWRSGPVMPLFDAARASEQKNQPPGAEAESDSPATRDDSEIGLPLPGEEDPVTTAEAQEEAEPPSQARTPTDDEIAELMAPFENLRLPNEFRVETLATSLRQDFIPIGEADQLEATSNDDATRAGRPVEASQPAEDAPTADQRTTTAEQSQPLTPPAQTRRPQSSAPNRIQFGDTGTRITPGQGRTSFGGQGASQQQRTSPLLELIDRLGPEDERVQALLADGVQLGDEIAAQNLLRDLPTNGDQEASQ